MGSKQKRLIPTIREVIRKKQYAYVTEKSYVKWIKRFIRYHNLKHPKDMREKEITAFLSHLANDRNIAASTQNQALNAIVFLYKEVLNIDLGRFEKFARARKSKLLPVVLSQSEVQSLLSSSSGVCWLIFSLLYGTGMRQTECLKLRVKDIDFERKQIFVRQGKGRKDRVVPFPNSLSDSLEKHLTNVQNLHRKDLGKGLGEVCLPNALAVKYPYAKKDWSWQWVFPSFKISPDPRSSKLQRFHLHPTFLCHSLTRIRDRY